MKLDHIELTVRDVVETQERVDAVHRTHVVDGMEIDPPNQEPWGSYTFHFTIEVACVTGDWA